jgi:hypothetical protein
MKYTILLLIFIVTISNICAQGSDFAPVGAKWYYRQFSSNYPYPEEFRLVEVTNEEVFQGQLCRKVTGLTGCGLPAISHVFTRNDSVFFWSDYSTKFQLLYDFRSTVGDSWLIDGLGNGPSGDSLRVFVDSLSQRVVSGDTLKVLHITNFGCYDWGNEIIEKLGNDYFLSPSFCLCENDPSGIRCYFDQSSDYHFVPYPCDTSILTSGTINPYKLNSLQVFPNPFYDEITVSLQLPQDEYFFKLYNQMGRLVQAESLTFSTTKLDTNTLPHGIYFWALIQSNEVGEKIKSGKCVKTAK